MNRAEADHTLRWIIGAYVPSSDHRAACDALDFLVGEGDVGEGDEDEESSTSRKRSA